MTSINELPLQDDTLIHARFVDFFQRDNASFEDVEFFLKKYSTVLPTDARDTCCSTIIYSFGTIFSELVQNILNWYN